MYALTRFKLKKKYGITDERANLYEAAGRLAGCEWDSGGEGSCGAMRVMLWWRRQLWR